jgi:polysaccharide export outer membrane protein
VTLQITRGTQLHSMPLEMIIRDPRQNVALRPGDVVTALTFSQSFVAMGATGKQEEIPFEASGITLAQAFGRVGGLLDSRSDPQGVFIFRFEDKGALPWPKEPVATTPDGQVPVIYRINLRDPRSFFVMQGFSVNNRDVLFVSNSPAADLQKFLSIVSTMTRQVVYTTNSL